MTGHVNEQGIVFRGHNPVIYTGLWWNSLLDELKSQHLPGLYPAGARMMTDNSGLGGAMRSVVYFTPDTVGIDEAIQILTRHGVEVYDVRAARLSSRR